MSTKRYPEYLQSPWWKKRRERSLYLAQNRCQSPVCAMAFVRSMTDDEIRELGRQRYRLEVHHLTYERLGQELDDDLIVLCDRCHCEQHGIPFVEDFRQDGFKSMDVALRGAIQNMVEALRRCGAPVNA